LHGNFYRLELDFIFRFFSGNFAADLADFSFKLAKSGFLRIFADNFR